MVFFQVIAVRHVRNALADQLRFCITEHLTERSIGKDNSTIRVAACHPRRRLLHGCAQARFRFAQCFFVAFVFNRLRKLGGNRGRQFQLVVGKHMWRVIIGHEFTDQFLAADQRNECSGANAFASNG